MIETDDNNKTILYPFAIDSGLGEMASEENFEQHVKNLIKQVVLTRPGERINRPDFGCGVFHMVFNPLHAESASLVETSIHQALTKWLGNLIEVEKIKAESVDTTINILIVYVVKVKRKRDYINIVKAN